MTGRRFDYIIAGAGAAGLSLAVHLIKSQKFSGKKVLIVDKGPKTNNDRTWCFWEIKPGLFEPVVYKTWKKLWFHAESYSALKDISPYSYKLIKGIDFYNYCFSLINDQANFTVEYGEVNAGFSDDRETGIIFNNERITAEFVFSSIQFDKPAPRKDYSYLLQHFKGFFIRTEAPVFNPAEATLMDFRVDQEQGTTFVYVMPFSPTEALIEYTLFSDKLLSPEDYDKGLRSYCEHQLKLQEYTIVSEEFGVIPMTDQPFSERNNDIVFIGTAGGNTKASSGYTFQFIQKNSKQIVESLIATGKPFIRRSFFKKRYAWFDSVLLHVLARKQFPGDKIFSLFIQKNPINKVLKFLDNESAPLEELRIIKPLPRLIFLKAGLKTLFR